MKIDHIAIWASDIDMLKDFYVKYFRAESNSVYVNDKTGFRSYFLTFSDGARLEIMNRADIQQAASKAHQFMGYCHLAISVGTIFQVLKVTKQLESDGYEVLGEPRQTGDGYFESVIRDPEGNRIEITC